MLKLFKFTTGENKIEKIQLICALVEKILFRMVYTTAEYRTDEFPSIAREYDGKYDLLAHSLKDKIKRGFQPWWDFERSCKDYFQASFHYSPAIKYVLWKYENYRRFQNRSHPFPPTDLQNKFGMKNLENTIDHITPQNPSFTAYSDAFKHQWLNNIGNLVLMSWGDNAEKRNKNPKDEFAMYDSLFVSHKEIRDILIANQKWGEDEIRTRRDNIFNFVVEQWGL
jgi:hypothetical protein